MKTPSIEGLRTVIANLKNVEEVANLEGNFNMAVGHICSRPEYGRPHCFAGWFLHGTGIIKELPDEAKNELLIVNMSYRSGAHLMAKTLGFADMEDLKRWADENPELWDNDCGYYMFIHENAFNYPGFSGAIRHLEELLERVEQMEANK